MGARFTEVADRVWVARYPWYDVNVTAIGGSDGLVVVDTHASDRAAREVVSDVRAIGAGPVTAVVNTHEHFDHTFGNATFLDAWGDLPIHAHEVAAARTTAAGQRIKEAFAASGDPHAPEVEETRIVPATVTFSSARVLDLGDRAVELIHPGRGHTGGDVVVSVPDAGVLLAGDLVEESGPPSFGEDCYPLEWAATLDLVLQLVRPDGVVVPGHGRPVDRDYVQAQRVDLGIVAETIRGLAASGTPVAQAWAAAEWPYAEEVLAAAITRGYDQLPRGGRRLPLA
ncbi:MBL fold metallo-hydrolase [Nocardioides sp.]|uniref:MBL fold metallo-hydrolase n=1 Tax=Nocardioides sp. TaxID=35761 RepID=UPI0027367305|nr:MBL fold metallo-hydrolase [Nocardioides sp.]MDP3891095.1 MBL fold metallo-hydrolase [Nocardioides sp.]